MTYDAVIFDLFGTLVDLQSFQDIQRSRSAMASALSVPGDDFHRLWSETSRPRETAFFATIEANLEHICETLGLPLESDRITAATQIRLDFIRRSLTPRWGAVETLNRLRAGRYKIGLISDCGPDVAFLWRDTPLAPLVDVAIFSGTAGFKKPDPRIYRMACERLAVKPQGCLYIGDGSSRELTGAAQVGMHPVLIRVPYEEAVHESLRPDAEAEWRGAMVSALKEVLSLVDTESEDAR